MPHTHVHPDWIAGREAAPLPTFVCSCTNDGLNAAWVHVAGELDIDSAPQLERTLRDAQLEARLIVLDLRELTFTDSSGVHVIANASIRARHAGRRMVLLRGHADVDRVFTLTGTSDDVEIVDIAPVEPPVQALLQLAAADLA